MKPTISKVEHCRVCNWKRIHDLGVRRNYYLANLDQTIPPSYAICQDCYFIFQGEYIGDKFLNYYYRQSPMLCRKEPTVFEVDQNERQGESLSRHVTLAGKCVLEIGIHASAFLRHLYHRFACTAYFEELSEEARMVLASQEGLHDFRSMEGEKKVDVVMILRDVLEHIFNLDSFLGYVHTILDKGGSLFIEVPDWSHFDVHTDPFIFEHLNQFDCAGLIQLLRFTCWQVEALEKRIHPDDPATPNHVQGIVARPTNPPLHGDTGLAAVFRTFAAIQYDGWKTALNKLLTSEAAGKSIAL